MTPLLGGNSGVMIRASGIMVPGIPLIEVEPTCSHWTPALSLWKLDKCFNNRTLYEEHTYLRYGSKKLIPAGLNNGFDLVIGKIQVELFIVNPAVTDNRLGVFVVLEPLQVTEEAVKFLRSL